jgi:hypothetical protein
MIENLLFDLRYAARILLRSPGFSFIAILTIALGVGATTAIYSVIDATLLHPLPFPKPAELIHIEADLPGIGAQDVGISVPEWKDLERAGMFESVSIAGHGANVNLSGAERPLRLSFKAVTPNYFALLGVAPQLGTVERIDRCPEHSLHRGPGFGRRTSANRRAAARHHGERCANVRDGQTRLALSLAAGRAPSHVGAALHSIESPSS